MLECLRAHREKLSEACRKEELKLNIVQARDAHLRPKLRKLCSQEIATHCNGVKPGALSPENTNFKGLGFEEGALWEGEVITRVLLLARAALTLPEPKALPGPKL